MEILHAIKKDHEKQKLLMKILIETSGDSDSRRHHFSELKHELKKHEKAEREHFYAPLFEVGDDETPPQNALFEHFEIDEKIAELEEISMSSPAWLHKMRDLRTLVEEHLEQEERLLFGMADEAFSPNEKQNLAEEYSEEKSKVAKSS